MARSLRLPCGALGSPPELIDFASVQRSTGRGPPGDTLRLVRFVRAVVAGTRRRGCRRIEPSAEMRGSYRSARRLLHREVVFQTY